MSEGEVVRTVGRDPEANGYGFWCAVAIYALVAFGPIIGHYIGRSMNPNANWDGFTPFDGYFGPELLFYGSGALSAYLLAKRDARARWPALFLAVWVSLRLLSWLWAWLHQRGSFSWLALGGGLFAVLVYVMQARYVNALRRIGALR